MKVRQILIVSYSLLLGVTLFPHPASAISKTVVVSEVQLQSAQSATEEFIELYNAANTPITIEGWQVEYLTASGTGTSSVLTLKGRMAAESFVLLAKDGYLPEADAHFDKGLNESGGHIRIVDAAGQEIDRVGWGAATSPEGTRVASPPKGKTLRRETDAYALFKDTDDNAADFLAATGDPRGGGLLQPIEEPSALCADIVLSEIVANPAGADSEGGEFIELYNPTDASVDMEGCSIQTDKMPATSLPSLALAPASFYVLELKDKLLNGGGKVSLIASASEQDVVYPALGEDEAWALFDGKWKRTFRQTPGAINILAESENVGGPAKSNDTMDCPQGKYRNPETNRCKTVETPTSTVACKPGQERNPETNRCRSVTTSKSVVTCAPGQERNPATNRCRKVAGPAANAPKPCPAGQERSPSTNRCRKIATAVSAQSSDSPTTQTTDRVNLGIIAVAGTAALGYGAFEYRLELRNWFARLKAKLPFLGSK